MAVAVIRVGFMALELAISVLLARQLGVSEFGLYAYAYAWMRLLALPVQAGLPTLVLREAAFCVARGEWSLLQGLFVFVRRSILLTTFALALLAIFLATQTERAEFEANGLLVIATFVLIPFIAVGNVRGATLRGLGGDISGMLPENIFRPAIFLALSILAAAVFSDLNAGQVMLLHVVASAITVFVAAVMIRHALPADVRAVPPKQTARKWIGELIPLATVAGLQVINAQGPIVLLGIFAPSEDVGLLRVAVQMSLFVGFGLTVVSLAIGPKAATLYAKGDIEGFRNLSQKANAIVLVISLLLGVVIFLCSDIILRLYGAEFSEASTSLKILAAGQIVAGSAGASLVLLNMSSKAHSTLSAVAVGAAATFLVAWLSIPSFGAVGGAIACAAGAAVVMWVGAVQLWRHERVPPALIGVGLWLRGAVS